MIVVIANSDISRPYLDYLQIANLPQETVSIHEPRVSFLDELSISDYEALLTVLKIQDSEVMTSRLKNKSCRNNRFGQGNNSFAQKYYVRPGLLKPTNPRGPYDRRR